MNVRALFLFPLAASVLVACGGNENLSSSSPSSPSSSEQEASSTGKPSSSEDTSLPSDSSSEETLPPKKDWDEDGVLKILEIGNSYGEDTFYYAPSILPAHGVESFVIGKLYIGGCSLDQHFGNTKNDTLEKGSYEYRKITDSTGPAWDLKRGTSLLYALQDEEWDFISFQQQSMDATQPEKYTHLDDFLSFVDENNPYADSRYVWNMTWAYPEWNQNSRYVEVYRNNPQSMYRDIVATTQKVIAPEKRFEKILVPGTAIENARTSFLKEKLFRDDLHLSYESGRYIAGMTYFSGLLDLPLSEAFSYAPESLSQSEVAAAKESAINALKAPYEITNSAFDENPEKRFDGVDKTIRLEAENGVLDTKKTKAAGCENASGGAIAADINDCGQGLEWIHYAPLGGKRTARIAYWTAMSGSKMLLEVNGQTQTVIFPEAQGWADGFHGPSIIEVEITLQQGQNNISLYKHGTKQDNPQYGGFAQIDYMEILGSQDTYEVSSLDLSAKEFTLQAERGHFHTGGLPFYSANVQGSYAVGEINAEGHGVDLSFFAPVSGTYQVQVSYSQGGAGNVMAVQSGESSLDFPLPVYEGQAFDRTNRSDTVLTLDLKEGERNVISFTRSASSASWFIIDAIHFIPVL